VFSAGAVTNYSIIFKKGTLTVTPASLEITANNQSKTYGATFTPNGANQFTVSAGTLYNGDTSASVTLTSAGYAASATVTTPGPDYSIVPSNAVGTGLGNYTITYKNGTLHINTAALTITATNVTKTLNATYTADTTPPSIDFTIGTLYNGDSVTSLTLTSAGYAAAAAVGAYDVTPSAAVGSGLSNYTITFQKGTLSVMYSTTCTAFGEPTHRILQPINPDGSSVNKAGSTVPAKFRATDANCNSIGTPGVVTSFKLIGQSSDPSAVINEDVVSTTPDTAFRWTGDQWIFNISTKGMKAGIKYTYQITLNDGSSIVFSFALK